MLITIGRFKLALGVDWALAIDKNELRAGKKAAGKKPIIVLSAGEGQFCIGQYSDSAGKGAYPAAAVLGLVIPNAIVSQKVTDDLTWVCVLQDGIPVPHQEFLCSHDQASRYLSDTLAMTNHDLYGDIIGSRGTLGELIGRLEASLAAKEIKKQAISVRELRPQGISAGSVLTGLAVVGLVAGGWQGWQKWQQHQIAEKARAINAAKAKQANMTAEQLEQEKRRLIQKFNADVAAARDSALLQATPGQPAGFFAAANAIRRSLPLSRNGIAPVGMKCTPAECVVTWEAQGKFVVHGDRELVAGQPVADATTPLTTRHAIAPADLPAAPVRFQPPESLRAALSQVLQLLPGVTLEPPQPIVVSPPPNLGLQPQTVGFSGKLRIAPASTASLVSAQAAVEILNQYPVTLSAIEFTGIRQSLGVVIDGAWTQPAGN